MQNQMTATAAQLRAKHAAALANVRAALKPGDSRRFELLRRLDQVAQQITARSRAEPKKV
jgi:hypothetical protein